MALTQISFPAEEADDWTDFIDMVKDWIVGHIRCSLTNYDADTAPALAAGSAIEMNGSYFYAATEQSISGTPTTDSLNYIYLDDTAYTLSWSNVAPTWNDAKQCWQNAGNDRCIGGCYYDGTNYKLKWVYTNQHCGPISRTKNPAFIGSGDATHVYNGLEMDYVAAGNLDTSDMVIGDFPKLALVTAFRTDCDVYSAGTGNITLRRGAESGSVETMATTSHTATGQQSDTSITSPVIDEDDYHYFVRFGSTAGTTLEIQEVLIEYTEIVRA